MSETVDIGKQQVAAVYAKALIGAAQKAGNTGDVIEELDSIVDDVLAKSPDFEATIGSSRISTEEKTGLIDRAFKGASEQIITFLKVLANHDRLDCIREVRTEAKRLYNDLQKRRAVEVITAKALTKPQRKEVVETLQKKMNCEVDLTEKVDEDIIGGMIVRVGDTIIDGSVRNKLTEMKSQAMQKVVEQIHGGSDRFSSDN